MPGYVGLRKKYWKHLRPLFCSIVGVFKTTHYAYKLHMCALPNYTWSNLGVNFKTGLCSCADYSNALEKINMKLKAQSTANAVVIFQTWGVYANLHRHGAQTSEIRHSRCLFCQRIQRGAIGNHPPASAHWRRVWGHLERNDITIQYRWVFLRVFLLFCFVLFCLCVKKEKVLGNH